MAKKHLKQLGKDLTERFSEAQKLYEKAAEYFSEDMVDPEDYKDFSKLKNSIDTLLSNVSNTLLKAFNREEFLKLKEDLKTGLNRLLDLKKALAKDPTATEIYKISISNSIAGTMKKMRVYDVIDYVACIKNRDKRNHLAIYLIDLGIDDSICKLNLFIKDRLEDAE